MRKIAVYNHVTLDGYYAAPDGGIDWVVWDPQADAVAQQVVQADTILFGRITYQGFEAHWPTVAADPQAPAEARAIGQAMNQMTKVVFSTTLTEVSWENSVLHRDGLVKRVQELKESDGGDVIMFGSGTLVQQLAPAGLIDDYLLLVSPVAIGAGKSMFEGVDKLNLTLHDLQRFDTGNVLLRYQPGPAQSA